MTSTGGASETPNGEDTEDTVPIRRVAARPRRTPAHRAREASDRQPAPAPRSPEQTPQRPQTPHEPTHGHAHAHGPGPRASRRVRIVLGLLLAPLLLAALVGTLLLYPWGGTGTSDAAASGTPVTGHVTGANSGPCTGGATAPSTETGSGHGQQCQQVTVTLTSDPADGHQIHQLVPREPGTPEFAAGDDVVLSYIGQHPEQGRSYQLVDFQRDLPLSVLAGLFALVVLAVGRWRGLAALASLAVNFAVLALFVLPAILAGADPLLVALCGGGVIMFAMLYLTHGISARTSIALLGVAASFALIAALSVTFSAAADLTGLDEQTDALFAALGHGLDARGLLLAGFIIGALGALDDMTVTQTSAVWELRTANPTLPRRDVFRAAMRIGRDHAGAAVNSLIMPYAGAALPVLLLSTLSQTGLGTILTSQTVAQEIIRTLVGSIGLVAAVPVTTVLATLIVDTHHTRRRTRPHTPNETTSAAARSPTRTRASARSST